jgi:flagellar basal body rod protein FlgF
MYGRREIFSEPEIGTTGAVKLRDGTEVQIEGKGTIVSWVATTPSHLATTRV